MRNEKGYVMISALLIMALLTIIGLSAARTSRTEVRIATNHLIYGMNFYAAESGLQVAPMYVWGNVQDMSQDDVKVPDNITWGYGDAETLSNLCIYDWKAEPTLDVDGNVILCGDPDGDYLYDENTDVGMPYYYTMFGNGTHPRGGNAEVKGTFTFQPAFFLPQAALFGHALIEKTGGSGSIEGADHSSLGCSNVADISTDGVMGAVDVKDMVLNDDGNVDVRTGESIYPVPLLRSIILGMNPDIMTGVIDTDESYSGILFVEPDADGNIDAKKLSGEGILYVDGDLNVNGGIGWDGMVIVNGSITVNGGGGLTVDGAVAAWDDILLHGSIAIKYDCEKISDMWKKYSRYQLTSWQQM